MLRAGFLSIYSDLLRLIEGSKIGYVFTQLYICPLVAVERACAIYGNSDSCTGCSALVFCRMCFPWVHCHCHFFSSIDEKDGLTVSLKESSRLVEEAKEREIQMQKKVKAMQQQLQVLTERDHEVGSELTHNTVFLIFS